MNTNIVLSLDQRRAKKNGTFPLVFRLTHNGKSTSISTGHSILPKDWDDSSRSIKRSYKGTSSPTRMNNYLNKCRAEMVDTLTKLYDKKELQYMTLAQVKDRLSHTGQSNSLFKFTETLIDQLLESKRIGTARSYKDVLSVLKTFWGKNELTFNDLNLDFLAKFEIWHMSKPNNGYGGLGVYMRTIRAIYNKAIKAGIADHDSYPFRQYQIKKAKPRKRAIHSDTILKIKSLELEQDSALARDRDIFLISFYLRGMPYADLAHLKRRNVVDGRVMYERQKTKEPITIKIPDQAWSILSKFIKEGMKPDNFIFPIVKSQRAFEQYKDVEFARNRYNKNLKKLAALAGIEENLTSYVARHSYASIADDMEVPITVISQMLGHQKISTTQSYLTDLRKNRLDEYQDKVVKGL